jgi:hypothetical protein
LTSCSSSAIAASKLTLSSLLPAVFFLSLMVLNDPVLVYFCKRIVSYLQSVC